MIYMLPDREAGKGIDQQASRHAGRQAGTQAVNDDGGHAQYIHFGFTYII